ncbi:MAG: rubredoxin [Clostridia bacterium]
MDIKELSYGEIESIFLNLANGCEKQYNEEESKLFLSLAKYYSEKAENKSGNIEDIKKNLEEEMSTLYVDAKKEAELINDRGAKRALIWSEKVTMLMNGLINRYKLQGDTFLDNTKIFVCEICGFIYVGDLKPEICPICKVPNEKIHEIV